MTGHLTVKYRALGIELDSNGKYQKHGRKQDKHYKRYYDIKGSLEEESSSLLFEDIVIFPYFLGLHAGR